MSLIRIAVIGLFLTTGAALADAPASPVAAPTPGLSGLEPHGAPALPMPQAAPPPQVTPLPKVNIPTGWSRLHLPRPAQPDPSAPTAAP